MIPPSPTARDALRDLATWPDAHVHPATLIGLASGGWIELVGDRYRLTDQGHAAVVEMAP